MIALFIAAQLAIVAPVAARDTAGHVDMRVGQAITLKVNSGIANSNAISIGLKWHSGNPTVASVSTKGVVTAKARGFATITAAAGTAKATTRVCVTAVEQELIAWKIKSQTTTIAEPFARPGFTRQAMMHIQLVTVPDFGPCVHWKLDSLSSVFARVDRAGVLHTARSVRDVKAYLRTAVAMTNRRIADFLLGVLIWVLAIAAINAFVGGR